MQKKILLEKQTCNQPSHHKDRCRCTDEKRLLERTPINKVKFHYIKDNKFDTLIKGKQ